MMHIYMAARIWTLIPLLMVNECVCFGAGVYLAGGGVVESIGEGVTCVAVGLPPPPTASPPSPLTLPYEFNLLGANDLLLTLRHYILHMLFNL